MQQAARLAPLRDEIRKGPAYLALRYMPQMPPAIAIGDLREGLSHDPYAPDLLNALVWIEINVGETAAAQADLATLQRIEPGFVPDYLRQP